MSLDTGESTTTPPPPAGTLDTSFGTGGQVVTHVAVHAHPDSVALQSDGKIVVAGYAVDSTRESIMLVRYAVDGTLDSEFGTAGIVLTSYGDKDARSDGMVLQPDGKIVVVGHSSSSCGLFRYLNNGALDPSFGVGGILAFAGGPPSCGRIALQSDGKILAYGLLRFGTDGSFDSSFKPSLGVGLAAPSFPMDFVVQPDGKIVFAVSSVTRGFFATVNLDVHRLMPDGTADSSFVGISVYAGQLATGFDNVDARLALQKDGKIVVTANRPISSFSNAQITRLLSDGTLDAAFDNSHAAMSTLVAARDVALQSNGKIVVVGDDKNAMAVTRFNPNGTVETAFGAAGLASTQYGAKSEGFGIAIQTDGRIVVAGDGYVPPIMLLTARFFGDAITP